MARRGRRWGQVGALVGALLLSGCSADAEERPRSAGHGGTQASRDEPRATPGTRGELTLAFAGDIHFERDLADAVRRPGATLGPMSRALASADLAVVNLESAVASGGRPASKELEDPSARYWFRSDPAALDLLARSGVDVATVANNHGADFGADGLRQTLAAAADGPLAVVGVGRTARQAFRPHRVTSRGTDVAVLAADASPRESRDPTWAAGEGGPGLASARGERTGRLLAAVRRAAAVDDLVVVYLHWGEESSDRVSADQRRLAALLSRAGADVVVGSHTHTLLGAGRLGRTYVDYGLGNFVWYHGRRPETGVLRLRVRNGAVVRDRWVPGRTPAAGGVPSPVTGPDRATAVADWRALRAGTGLAPVRPRTRGTDATPGTQPSTQPSTAPARLPAYTSGVSRIGPRLARRMRGSSHHAGCPVRLRDLRRLRVTYVGFDREAHTGRLVVDADVARDVVGIFERLYDARWPIRRLRLVDAYGGDDDRSMAADNSSAYNCRNVAGTSTWSDHAYGRAIDLNPVENPYVTSRGVAPPAGRRYADVDRSRGADTARGVIRAGDPVTRAFAAAGWTWGGVWNEPDYQHFSAP